MNWKDAEGRGWETRIDVLKLKKIKESLGVNLMDCISGNLLEELSTDVSRLVDVLYILHKEQSDERKLTDEDFALGLYGDALEDATQAFISALVDFCPSRQRTLLKLAMDKAKAEQDAAYEKLVGSLETSSTLPSSESPDK